MSNKIKHVTDTTFNSEVLESATPVLVDYWAEWCGPCKMIGPVLDESAESYGDRLTHRQDQRRPESGSALALSRARHPDPHAVQER